MSDVWREQRGGKPRIAVKNHVALNQGLKLTAAGVLDQRLKVLASDIFDLQQSLSENIPGAASFLAKLEKQFNLLKGTK
jgi:hypothetical protein